MKSIYLFVLCLIFVASCNNGSEHSSIPNTPQEALLTLIEGNRRFVKGNSENPNSDIARVEKIAPNQAPFAAVVGCSDSRVPVELIFDRGLGDIFVIRTAGNNVGGDMVMGSVEYAVEHLGVKVLLVLGHESCGGITSAITPIHHDGAVENLLHHIQIDIPEYVGKPDLLNEAIHSHTRSQVETLLQNRVVADRVNKGELIVKGAYYNILTGEVTLPY